MEYLETFFLALVIVTVATAAYTAGVGAPWVPTRKTERQSVEKLADLSPGEKFYDLGSGTGTMIFALANARPDVEVIGVELSLLPYLYSRGKKLLNGRRYQNVQIYFRDLWRFDFSDADALFIFLIPGRYERLQKKIFREAKPTCRIILEAWPVPSVEPLEHKKTEGSLSMYLYRGDQF